MLFVETITPHRNTSCEHAVHTIVSQLFSIQRSRKRSAGFVLFLEFDAFVRVKRVVTN